MNEATTIRVGGAESAVRPAGVRSGRRLRWRHLWIVPGLAIAIFANELGKSNGVGILLLIAFGIAPDVPRLFGIGRGHSGGAGSFALRAFNVLHHPVAPAAAVAISTVAVAVAGVVPAIWLVGSLVWFSHIVIGRGVGDVPRHPKAARADA
jgi:hypothetical protein